jgi:hypothetical protein
MSQASPCDVEPWEYAIICDNGQVFHDDPTMRLELTDQPDADDEAFVIDQTRAYNRRSFKVGPNDFVYSPAMTRTKSSVD